NTSEAEVIELDRLLASDPNFRREFRFQAEIDTNLREASLDLAQPNNQILPVNENREGKVQIGWRWTLASLVAIAAMVMVMIVYSYQPKAEPTIAKITGLSGPLEWTGNGGRVVHNLTIGSELSGGTIDGLSPDSWFELEFNDGSTVMISGNSMLTFSDRNQKVLYLKSGNISANVSPQPEDSPMIIHTRSAMLTVLGTRFEVEAGLSSTALSVSEGEVRLKRLSDGQSVNVPSKHRVVATAGEQMLKERMPDYVHSWKSQLQNGPTNTYGKWSPTTEKQSASLKAIPYVSKDRALTLYLLGMPVSRADHSPVILKPRSQFTVRGRLDSKAAIYIGVQVAHPNGEFAGKYLAKSAIKIDGGQDFEAVYQLSDFSLDPSVSHMKDVLSEKPDELVLTCIWCFTNTGGPTGLGVTEIELIPPSLQTPSSLSK
ncbi:MAG: hypothetical protein COA78_14055, partial [Blastopirellula sp.]